MQMTIPSLKGGVAVSGQPSALDAIVSGLHILSKQGERANHIYPLWPKSALTLMHR